MAQRETLSRRRFVKSVAGAAGAAALPGYVAAQVGAQGVASAAVQPAPLSLRNVAAFPGLTPRGAGWLRFLWEKATRRDDWSSSGVPHPWWDQYTAPVVLSYGRFDLSYSAYGLLLMADQTPAWREVYTRIADELTARYPTYWGAHDWFTQIGDDPKRANYPPALMNSIPEALRGKYNRIGWTANGIEPWGLQSDPIAAPGYLFFRAWFLLLLATYKYISGDDKWARPFKVTGYHDEAFDWDTHRIAERLEAQYREHPEGPHCENTKIWPFCNAAGGLGMYLYDKVFGKSTHRAFENFIGYARENYFKVGADGRLQSVTSYYDPIEKFHSGGGVAGGLMTAHLLQPQNPALGRLLYDAAANALGWRNPAGNVTANTTGLVMAKEMGDEVAYGRLREAAERQYDPRTFGEHQEMFGWFFNNSEAFPRGQGSAMLMAAEIAGPGDWTRAFEAPHLDKYAAPTVEGIEFPSLGVSQAWNDTGTGTLRVGTYAAAPEKRGASTRWRVSNLPSVTNLTVRLNGQPFTRFAAVGPRTIELTSTIDAHQYEIVSGYRGEGTRADAETPAKPRAAASASLLASTGDGVSAKPNPFAMSPGCPCCPPA